MNELISSDGQAIFNVASHLDRQAREQPQALAVAVAVDKRGQEYLEMTAEELRSQCDRCAHALVEAGITAGMRVVLMVPPSPEFFALTFALFKIAAVPVFVDPGMGIARLKLCLDEARPEAFVGVAKAHFARWVLGWAKKSLKHFVFVGPRATRWMSVFGGRHLRSLLEGALDTAYPAREVGPDDLAAILFTSGSTGVPKGVRYRHRMFCAQVEAIRQGFGIEAGERDLSTFPLFALFGPALGMASIAPAMDFSRPGRSDPRLLVDAIHRHQCTNAFVSPALVEILGRYVEQEGVKLPSLRRVISAGAPAVPAALRRLSAALEPDAEIYTPYGATEAMPLTRITSREILEEGAEATEQGAGVCVGHPLPGVEIKIIAIDDAPLSTWAQTQAAPPYDPRPKLSSASNPEFGPELGSDVGTDIGPELGSTSGSHALAGVAVGEIVVCAEVVSHRYWEREADNQKSKIVAEDGRIWHRMGDLGYLDDRGRLWVCGRKGHRVHSGGRMYLPLPTEAVFNAVPGVYRSALVEVSREGQSHALICIEFEKGLSKAKRRTLLEEFPRRAEAFDHSRGIRLFLEHPSFPMDVRHNAKIFREELATWAHRTLPSKFS